jgi:hypothetical protein
MGNFNGTLLHDTARFFARVPHLLSADGSFDSERRIGAGVRWR